MASYIESQNKLSIDYKHSYTFYSRCWQLHVYSCYDSATHALINMSVCILLHRLVVLHMYCD